MPDSVNSEEKKEARQSGSPDRELFAAAYRKLKKDRPVPACRIEFFPYRSIKNTLRIHGGIFYFRISELLREAPPSILEAIFEILLCRTFHISGYERANRTYSLYLSSSEFRSQNASTLQGNHHSGPPPADLHRRFKRLNEYYFDGSLRDLHVYWVKRRSRRILGQFIFHRDEILLNSEPDHPLVPDSVIDFIIYHEMLHAYLAPLITAKGRKIVHHAEFRRREKQFEGYGFVSEFIKENF